MNDTQSLRIGSEEQLMDELEAAQDRIEELEASQKDYDQLKMENSKLSSQNSELRRLYQDATDEIARKDERIAMLSNSDQELKEAQKIRSEAEDQKSANEKRSKELDEREARIERDNIEYRATCDREIEQVRTQCSRDNATAAKKLANAEAYEKQTGELLENEKSHIQEKAEEIKANEIRILRRRAERYLKERTATLTAKYAINKQFDRFVFVLTILFSAGFGVFSKRLKEDAMSIWNWLVKALTAEYQMVDGWGHSVEKWLDSTEAFNWLASPAHILILLLALAAVVVLLIFLGIRYVRFLRDEDEFDDVCKWIMAGTGFLCISASRVEPSVLKNWNLILTWLVIQAIVPVIKGIRSWWGTKHEKPYDTIDTKGLMVKVIAIIIIVTVAVGWILMMRSLWFEKH